MIHGKPSQQGNWAGLCPPECGIEAILIITLPQGTFINITPRLVLMGVISSPNNLILTN